MPPNAERKHMSQRIAIAAILVGWVCAGCGANKDRFVADADGTGHPVSDAQADRGQTLLGFDTAPTPLFDAVLATGDTAPSPSLDTAPKPALDSAPAASDTAPKPAFDSAPTPLDTAPKPAPDTAPKSTWPSDKYITVDAVYAHLKAANPEMLLINVVDAQYYNLGFVAGSLKIPWDALAGRLSEVDPARHIVLYCRKGVRSESAYTTLMDHAYPHVWVMDGGIERWIAAGYPTVAQ